jgi:hypothetical protein
MIGALASAVSINVMSLRIETPPRGDASTLASPAAAIAPRSHRYQILQMQGSHLWTAPLAGYT